MPSTGCSPSSSSCARLKTGFVTYTRLLSLCCSPRSSHSLWANRWRALSPSWVGIATPLTRPRRWDSPRSQCYSLRVTFEAGGRSHREQFRGVRATPHDDRERSGIVVVLGSFDGDAPSCRGAPV